MMFKSLYRAALVAALFVFCTSAAFAADTWLPNYDRDTKVYVDPALANDPANPVAFDSGFRQRLAEESAKNNVDIYVIATKQGDDLSGDSKKWAPEILHTPLWNKWGAAPSFSERNVLILLWVRAKDSPTGSSIAARSGSRLQGYGINRQRFYDASGPVMTAIKAHWGDKPGTLIAIAENVNGDVSRYLAAQAQASRSDTGTKGEDALLIGLLVLLVAGIFVGAIIVVNRPARSSYGSNSTTRTTRGTSPRPVRPTSGGSNSPTSGSGSRDVTGAIITGGVLGGLAGSALSNSAAEKAKSRKKDSGSGSSDSGTTTTTTTSSCSSSSCSSSSCGGGGCGGGGCGGG